MKKHIVFNAGAMELCLLDQRLLPHKESYFVCRHLTDVIHAIKDMVVRGAPAIGVAAAYGCVLAAAGIKNSEDWRQELDFSLGELLEARPTAVNLSWAVETMRSRIAACDTLNGLLDVWMMEAARIESEDLETCRQIGRQGQILIKDGDTVLTHCNAGALATAGYGTALAPIRMAFEMGKKVSVIADETRPLLQGARLTAYELAEDGIPVAVACDNAAALLLGSGKADLVIVGADRIAANGDTANKIGTCGLAIIARHYSVPFYVAAPLSTLDPVMPDGAGIPIEQRQMSEITCFAGVSITPTGIEAINYAFDVTPAALIDGIITEAGILRAPYEASIAQALMSGKRTPE